MAKGVKGRPSLLTPELQAQVVTAIGQGSYPEVAARAAGLSRTTFYRWMQEGENEDSDKRDFWDAVKKAEAAAETTAVETIRADGSWQSKAWLLERRYAHRWRRREDQEVTHSGSVRTVIEIHHDVTDREEAIGLLAETDAGVERDHQGDSDGGRNGWREDDLRSTVGLEAPTG